jgi:tetratricopeptide (TPR) repeat protein
MYSDDPHELVFELIAEQRYGEAAERLEEILADEPGNAAGFALRALCLGQLGEWQEAVQSGRHAVAVEPDMAFAHWALAHVLADRRELRAALPHAREAVRLDPDEADHHALLARIDAASGRWDDALRAAEAALRLEHAHPGAQRIRALVLQQRGRAEEADSAFLNALIQNPDDAFAYAGRGWSMLRTGGESASAVEHFQHALHLAPDSEWAREGLITALKARNPVYRVMLRYFFWLSALTPRARVMIVLGGLIGYNVLRRVAAAVPPLAYVIWPLLGLYLLFLLLSWTAEPLFDSLLRLNPAGRAALTRDRVSASNWVLATIGAALAAALATLVVGPAAIPVACVLAFLVLPVSGTFQCEPGWPRRTMAALCAAIALLAVASPFLGNEGGALALTVAVVLIVLGTWMNRWLVSVHPRPRR